MSAARCPSVSAGSSIGFTPMTTSRVFRSVYALPADGLKRTAYRCFPPLSAVTIGTACAQTFPLKPIRAFTAEAGGDYGPGFVHAGRAALVAGDFAAVNRWLGRPYTLQETVVTGEARGRTIGFPTANLPVTDDTNRRVKYVESKGLLYVGTGVSGGEEGARFGPALMPGGDPAAYKELEPIWNAVAAKVDAKTGRPLSGAAPGKPIVGGVPCATYIGENGAGHYVKMVHNGIEYSMMQGYAEGFELMSKSDYNLDLGRVADLWMHGSVVRSWLLELAVDALKDDPKLDKLKGFVQDSGEGRWMIADAIEKDVPVPTLTTALFTRFRSRQDQSFAEKMLAALRNAFGGHAVRR